MMFKKGDVVEWVCDEYGHPAKEGTIFSVIVTNLITHFDEFSGVVVSAQEKADYREGTYVDCWDTKQFKLKQQDIISNDTPDNAFPVLKDGMVVTTRGRGSYLVVGEKLLDHGGYNSLHDYTEEGEVIGASDEFDIVKVYSGVSLFSLDLERYIALNSYQLVWQEQKNAKAIAEIEQQMANLQEQINTLQENLAALREER